VSSARVQAGDKSAFHHSEQHDSNIVHLPSHFLLSCHNLYAHLPSSFASCFSTILRTPYPSPYPSPSGLLTIIVCPSSLPFPPTFSGFECPPPSLSDQRLTAAHLERDAFNLEDAFTSKAQGKGGLHLFAGNLRAGTHTAV